MEAVDVRSMLEKEAESEIASNCLSTLSPDLVPRDFFLFSDMAEIKFNVNENFFQSKYVFDHNIDMEKFENQ